jgi:hypothetical protein
MKVNKKRVPTVLSMRSLYINRKDEFTAWNPKDYDRVIKQPEQSEYTEQADKFLAITNTSIVIEFLKYGIHFEGDKQERDIYSITVKRGAREFSFDFGNSINSSRYCQDPNNRKHKYLPSGQALGLNYRGKVQAYVINNFSLYPGSKPSNYDILTYLTKYDPCTFGDFCADYGYDTDSRTAKKTYKAVKEEYKNVCIIWSDDEIEQLQEIN